MKRRAGVVLAIAMALSMVSMTLYGRPSGETKNYSLKNFSGIETTTENQSSWKSWIDRWGTVDILINVVKSNRYSVSTSADDPQYLDAVSVEKNGNVLQVKAKAVKIKVKNRPEVVVTVNTPDLEYIDLNGTAKMNVEGDFSSRDVEIRMSGASSLSGYSAKADNVMVDLSGAASVNDLSLKASYKTIFELSGAVEIRGLNLRTARLDMDASGAASVRTADLYADCLELEASGAASLSSASVYFGEALMSLSGGTSYSIKGAMPKAGVVLSGAARLEFVSTEKGESLNLECAGASAGYFEEAPYRNVKVSAYGASKAKVNASDVLKTDISSTASLDYYGNPGSVTHSSDNIRSH